MNVVVLLDSTVLSNFAYVQRPDLLCTALGEIAATTPMVMTELRTGETQGKVPGCDWSWLPVVELTAEEQRLTAEFSLQLDPGEAECLAVAQVREGRILSDDLAARRCADQRGIEVSGTLGVLLLLVNQCYLDLDEADKLLRTMVEHGYHSPVASFRELVHSSDSVFS